MTSLIFLKSFDDFLTIVDMIMYVTIGLFKDETTMKNKRDMNMTCGVDLQFDLCGT